MYIVAIGWLYIVVLMAISETNWVAGILTFTFYGLFPLSILLWLFGGPVRRRRQAMAEAATTQPVPANLSEPQGTVNTAPVNATASSLADEQASAENRQNPQSNQ